MHKNGNSACQYAASFASVSAPPFSEKVGAKGDAVGTTRGGRENGCMYIVRIDLVVFGLPPGRSL